MSNDYEQYKKWIEDEQRLLWDDLKQAITFSLNGIWSIKSSHIACRIVEAARLVGPSPADGINWPILASGVYAQILISGGIAAPAVPWDNKSYQRMALRYGTREDLAIEYAGTLLAIKKDAGFIRTVG